jgi:hypothetical protein
LRFASIRMVSFRRDLHPQDGAHAGRTNERSQPEGWLPYSSGGALRELPPGRHSLLT